jgi:hypothetical protein
MTGRYPDPRRSGTFCRELVDTLVEESSASERLRALSEPTQAGRPARAGRSACKDRLSPYPRDGADDPQRPRCLLCWETPLWMQRTRPGEPDKDHCSFEGGPLSTGCSHPVDKGPALVSSCVVPCSDGAGARARAGY